MPCEGRKPSAYIRSSLAFFLSIFYYYSCPWEMSKRHEMLHAQLLISGVERYCYPPPIQTFNGRCLIIHYHQMLQSVAHGICRNSINILTAIGISHFVAITASLKYYQTNHTLSISWGKSLRPPPSTVCRDSRLARCKPEGIGRATRRKEVPVCRDIYKYPPIWSNHILSLLPLRQIHPSRW